MKITKQRLAKIIKEELALVREGGDPVGPVEAQKIAELLQNLGFTLTRGGMNSFIEFLQGLESSGDLSASPDTRRGALAEQEPQGDAQYEVMVQMGRFLAKLANEGHDELANEFDQILVQARDACMVGKKGQ